MDYMPELPSHLKQNSTTEMVPDDDFCPELPPHLRSKQSTEDPDDFCPQLPPHLKKPDNKSSVPVHDDGDTFCPQLPAHLQKQSNNFSSTSQKKSENDDEFCPQLPPHLINISQKFQQNNQSQAEDAEDDEFCPALPPHLINKQSPNTRVLGPTLPKDYQPPSPSSYKITVENSEDDSSQSEEETGYVIGPLPSSEPVDMDKYIEETIYKRNKAREDKLAGKDKNGPLSRESWMLELPEDKPLFQGLGLQARQFAKRAKTDRGDTTVWTDTPADKERKAQRAAERKKYGHDDKSDDEGTTPETIDNIATRKRDEQLQSLVDDYNAEKRPAPMVDTHKAAKVARKGRDGDDGTSVTGVGRERKMFSREEDMAVNKFDEAQKATILKKAKQLNDRFSSGKAAKYL